MKFFQQIENPTLDFFMSAISQLVSSWAYFLLILFIYWCIQKKFGYSLGIVLLFSSGTNTIASEYFDSFDFFSGTESVPVLESGLQSLSSSLDSRSQNTVAFYTFLSLAHSKKWIGFSVFVGILVAFAQLYLGNSPEHVVYAIALGMMCSGFLYLLNRFLSPIVFYILPVILIALMTMAPMIDIPEEYFYKLAAFVGFSLGGLFEHYFVRFGNARTIAEGTARFFFGLIVTIAVYLSLRYLLRPYPIAYYGITAFVASGVIPMVFEKEIKQY